jgi:tRNA(Ile)-lysidine synthase
MDLLSRFLMYIESNALFNRNDHLLIATSGGVDSVVLAELCSVAGYKFTLAHCNFQLRGEESRRDEAFVKMLAKRYSVNLFDRRFDTEKYANENKVSIQVAARDLRYAWFNELIEGDLVKVTDAKKWIVTAHHLDDNIETVLMNFFKGTGIAGMRGMLPKSGAVIRPLLFARKEELIQFAKANNLEWMEDSSNQSDKYSRNYLRHQVIPLIEQIYPAAIQNIANSVERFREIEKFHATAIHAQIKKLVEVKGHEQHIPILKLKKLSSAKTILYALLQQFGFAPVRVDEVMHLMDSDTGKYLLSSTHRILKNRNWLIISPIDPLQQQQIVVGHEGAYPFEHGTLQLAKKPVSGTPVNANNGTALLDAQKINFPLMLRKWKQGDYFYPLGMNKKKKLARFFIDQKLSLNQKEKAWVVEMDKKIIWVMGMRIDDRFKVTPNTKEILQIELHQNVSK